jgi:hypothetical protein
VPLSELGSPFDHQCHEASLRRSRLS